MEKTSCIATSHLLDMLDEPSPIRSPSALGGFSPLAREETKELVPDGFSIRRWIGGPEDLRHPDENRNAVENPGDQ